MILLAYLLPVEIHLGLNVNRFLFLNFKDAYSILENHFKFWCGSYQTFSEILRISKKIWQLSLRLSKKFYLYCKLLRDTLMFLKNIRGEAWTHESPRRIYTSAAFLGDSITKNPWKLEDRRLSWQSFSEILRISKLKLSV